MKDRTFFTSLNGLDEEFITEAESAKARSVLPYILAPAAGVCIVAAVSAAILIPALRKPAPKPTDAIPPSTPTEAVTPTPVTPTPTNNNKKSLKKRYQENDPDVNCWYMSIDIEAFDAVLERSNFLVVCKYNGKNVKEHRYKFEVIESYLDHGDVHPGDILVTGAEPCDVMLTDVNTGEVEYLYTSALKSIYDSDKTYILPGVYVDGVPHLMYGLVIAYDDIANAKNCGYPLFDAIGGHPASFFRPSEDTTAEEFIDYCLARIRRFNK